MGFLVLSFEACLDLESNTHYAFECLGDCVEITMPKPRLGKLPPRYVFALNPHSDYRATRCPKCDRPTTSRKFALMIHVDPQHLVALGKTCRYCPKDELIIAHQDELEALLAQLFTERDPSVIGNNYLVVGTVEREAWHEGLTTEKTMSEMFEHLADFRDYIKIEYEPGGWYPSGQARRHRRKSR